MFLLFNYCLFCLSRFSFFIVFELLLLLSFWCFRSMSKISFAEIYQLSIKPPRDSVIVAQKLGFLPSAEHPPNCGKAGCSSSVRLVSYAGCLDGCRWKCSGTYVDAHRKRRTCTYTCSVQKNSFFAYSKLPIWKILIFVRDNGSVLQYREREERVHSKKVICFSTFWNYSFLFLLHFFPQPFFQTLVSKTNISTGQGKRAIFKKKVISFLIVSSLFSISSISLFILKIFFSGFHLSSG